MRLVKAVPLLLPILFSAVLSAQTYNGKELVVFEAIPEAQKIVPGQPFYVALHMEMAEGWHTYWTYSGEAGLGTDVSWELPEGMVDGGILSPTPILKEEDTGLMAYAYYGEVTHFVRLFAPGDWEPGEEVEVKGAIDWLVCEEPCIPGDAEFSFTLTVAEERPEPDSRVIEAKQALPQLLSLEDAEFPHTWVKDGEFLYLLTAAEGSHGSVEGFYPLPPDGVFIEIPEKPRSLAEFENLSEYEDEFAKAIAVEVKSGLDQIEHLDGLLVFGSSEDSDSLTGLLTQMN